MQEASRIFGYQEKIPDPGKNPGNLEEINRSEGAAGSGRSQNEAAGQKIDFSTFFGRKRGGLRRKKCQGS